jgi:hypothetical protein
MSDIKPPTKAIYKKEKKDWLKFYKKKTARELVTEINKSLDDFESKQTELQKLAQIIGKRFDNVPSELEVKKHKQAVKDAEKQREPIVVDYFKLQPKIDAINDLLIEKVGFKFNPQSPFSTIAITLKIVELMQEEKKE